MKKLITVSLMLVLTGCAGKVDYIRPSAQVAPSSNTKVVDRPRDAVWNTSVQELGKMFFVINNLDKASGLINISYTGDPERYVDCGRIKSYVMNARGERTYDFAGAKAQQAYEIMNNGQLFYFDRRMNLEGRVNLIFEEISPTATRVTANTRYVVTRSFSTGNQTQSNTISFNSGAGALFPADTKGQAAECVANGEFEREILSAIK